MRIKSYESNSDFVLSYPVGNDLKAAANYGFKTAQLFNTIKSYTNRDINIWCRGSSGAILSALFSSRISNNAKIIHVKKDGENAHSSYPHPIPGAVNIIVDDFIDSGATLKAIYEKMKDSEEVKRVDVLVVESMGHLTIKAATEKLKFKVGFVPTFLITNHSKE